MPTDDVGPTTFLRSYLDRTRTVVGLLSALTGIVGVTLRQIPNQIIGDAVLIVLLGIVITKHYEDWVEQARVEKSADLEREKETESDVYVRNKKLRAEVNPEGKDKVSHEYELTTMSDDITIDSYIATVFTDRELEWQDLELATVGCEVMTYGRDPTDGLVKFPIEFKIDPVSSPETHTMSYSINYDTLEAENDWVSTIVREPTDKIEMEVLFPEGTFPEDPRAWVVEDGDANLADVSPNRTQNEEGKYVLEWERTDVGQENEYLVTWGEVEVLDMFE